MRKCKVCGRRFRLLAKNRYEVMIIPYAFSLKQPEYFNAFDCPKCGCQNIIGIVEKNRVQQESEDKKCI